MLGLYLLAKMVAWIIKWITILGAAMLVVIIWFFVLVSNLLALCIHFYTQHHQTQETP